jgi:molybdate transport system substrate-binding protein
VVATFPADSHVPIVYPLALTRAAVPGAPAFIAYLRGPAGQAVFRKYGFTIMTAAGRQQ